MLGERLFSTQYGQQALRMRRFVLASVTYAMVIPLLFVARAFGLIQLAPVLVLSAAMLAVTLALFATFHYGLNTKFRDPSLTWLQILAAMVILMGAVYSFDEGRAFVLLMILVALLFGAFRFDTREFVRATLIILAGYALVINLLMYLKPATVNVYVEWFQWLGMAAFLPFYAVVGGRISELRRRLQHSNEELRSALAAVRKIATHDSLTGLPNRMMFNEQLQHALARVERDGTRMALFVLDLDRFKVINDTLGHTFGDRVLQEVARRLLGCVRGSDTVARVGGDEFVIMLEDYGAQANLEEIARKLIAAVTAVTKIEGREISLSVSIGISSAPLDGRDSKTLFSNADIAMYASKEMGRSNFQFYSADQQAHTIERFALETGLRYALERGELRVYYQPKVDLATGALTGVEALLRWQHPERGLIGAEEFIWLAEETGLIVPIGLWTLREVCARMKAWQDKGLPRIPVAVNLSALQFRQDNLVPRLAEILQSTGLDPAQLEIEITESMVMQDPEQAVTRMVELRRMGVRLSIDDFGTGYSSLGYLKRFPINSLKVDKIFVRDLPHSVDDVAITRAVIAMAHSLSMNVIAEGVEQKAQLDALLREGCDEYQGFICQPPLSEDEFLSFARDSAGRAPAKR